MQVKSPDPVLNSVLIRFKEKLPIYSNQSPTDLQKDADFVESITDVFKMTEKQLDNTLDILAGQLDGIRNIQDANENIKKDQSILIVLRVMMYASAYYWMQKSNENGESLPMLSLPLYSSNLIGPLGTENAKSPTSGKRFSVLPALPSSSVNTKIYGKTKKLAELDPIPSLKADSVIQAITPHLPIIDASGDILPYLWNTDSIQASGYRDRHRYFFRTAFANKSLKSTAYAVFEHINEHKPTLSNMIENASSRLLFFVSTSNWQTVFNYIQTHLLGWLKSEKGKTQAVLYSYLEACNISQERLVDVLDDALKLTTMDLTDQGQAELAMVLANLIRNFIIDYPAQFHALWKSKLNIVNTIDKLCEYFYDCFESKKKKTVFVPVLSSLFFISPVEALEIAQSTSVISKKKKIPFSIVYELLRKPTKGKLGFDVAFYCHIDLLRATLATYDGTVASWVHTFFADLLENSLKEIREKIIDPSKPISMKEEDSFITERNVQSYITYLLEFDSAANAQLTKLVEGTYPAAFKSMVITGMLNVWLRLGEINTNTRDTKIDRVALVNMRSIFSHCSGVKKERQGVAKSGRGQPLMVMDKDRNIAGDEHSRIAIIKATLLFWREYPESSLFGETGNIKEAEFRKLLLQLKICCIEFNGPIRTLALTLISEIFDPSIFTKWAADSQGQPYARYWRMHSYTVCLYSREAISLEAHDKFALAKDFLALCCHLFKVQSAVMNILNVSYLDTFTELPEKYQVVASFEMAFICLVTSQDANISRLAVAAMNCFLQCISLTENIEDNPYINFGNFEIYTDFVRKFGPMYWTKVFSLKAHQKRIRNMLKSVEGLTVGVIGAWDEMHKRWHTLYTSMIPVKNTTVSTIQSHGQSHTSLVQGKLSATNSYSSLNELGEIPLPKFKGRGALNVKSMLSDHVQQSFKPAVVSTAQPQDYYSVVGLMVCITNLLLDTSDRQGHDSHGSSVFSLPQASDKYVKEVVLKDMKFTEDVNGIPQFKFVTMDTLDIAKGHLSNIVNSFIDELISVLLHDNVQAREMVNEILGYDISGALCINMCRLWCNILRDEIADGPDPVTLEREILVADAILFISAAILSRTEDNLAGPKGLAALEMHSVPLDTICALLTKWVNNVSTPSDQQERLKGKIANFAMQLVQRVNFIGIKDENAWKNEILEAVLEWSGLFRISANQKFDFENRKTFEFNMTLQKCMTNLLKDLAINKTGDKTSTMGESEADTRSNLFFKYFRFFSKGLEAVKSAEYTTSKLEMEQFKFKQQHVSLFKSELISGLSNLISANMDVGIRQTLSIAYSQDPMLRGVIINVLKNVLKVGSSGSLMKALQEHEFDPDAKYSVLFSALFEEPYLSISCLASIAEFAVVEEFVTDILELGYHTGKVIPLLSYFVKLEVALTDDVACIFRRTSLTTRLLAMFSRKETSEFVQRAVGAPVNKAIKDFKNQEVGYEIDPARIDNANNLEINLKNVESLLALFFETLIESSSAIPSAMRQVLSQISKFVDLRFPRKGSMAVGALLILRLVTPAIISPETYDLVKTSLSNRNLKRGMVIVGKIIQNLANGVKFGSKEAHMISFNKFLDASRTRYDAFINDLIANSDAEADPTQLKFNHTATEESAFLSAARVHKTISIKISELSKLPQSETFRIVDFVSPDSLVVFVPSAPSQPITVSVPEIFVSMTEKLSLALECSGPIPDIEKCIQRLEKMKKFTSKEVLQTPTKPLLSPSPFNAAAIQSQSLKDRRAVYISMKNKSKPALYYIARKVKMSETDDNSLKLFIINEIKMYLGAPMDVFVDLTLFSEENEWSEAMLECFDPLINQDAAMGMQNLILINPNTHFFNCCKKYTRVLSPPKLNHKVEFVTNLKELTTFVTEDKIDLPVETMLMLEGKGTQFTGVNLIRKKREFPVTFYLLPEILYMVYPKKQELGNLVIPVVDAILISSILSTGTVTDSDDKKGTEFFVKTESAEWRFSSSQKETILQQLEQMVSLSNLVAFKGGFEQRQLNAEDLPGILLNIALYNICSEQGSLRNAGLELLIALEGSRDRDRIEMTPTTAMPLNNQHFVTRMSSELALVEKQMTYEFLIECLRGFSEYSTRTKFMSLKYMEPWIKNLNTLEPRSEAKMIQVLDAFVKILVIRENEDHTFLVQANIWNLLGKDPQFVDILLPRLVESAKSNNLDSKQTDMLISVAIALLQHGGSIASLFNLAHKTYSSALQADNVSKLTEGVNWKAISIVNRIFANATFDCNINLEIYLSQILYFVLLSIGSGSHLERRTVQVILHNVFHQLYAKYESAAIVKGIVYLVDSKNLNLFGQSGALPTSDQFSLDNFPLKQFDTDPIFDGASSSDVSSSDLTQFTELVLDVMQNAHTDPAVCRSWRQSFSELFVKSAFSSYRLAPDRLFVPLSFCMERLDVETFKKFNNVMVQEFPNDARTKLIASSLNSLCFLLKRGLEDEEILPLLFWLCLGLMQFGQLSIFKQSLTLLHLVLSKVTMLETTRKFCLVDFQNYGPKLEPASSALDTETKLHPKKSFALYTSAILLRGLSDLSTSAATKECLNFLLTLSSRNTVNTEEALTFMLLLAPTESFPGVFLNAGLIQVEDKDVMESSDKDSILLIDRYLEKFGNQAKGFAVSQACMLSILLDHWKTEEELLVVCRVFARIAQLHPSVLSMISAKLAPKLQKLSAETKLLSVKTYIEIISRQSEPNARGNSNPGAELEKSLALCGTEGVFAEAAFDRLGTEALKIRAKLVSDLIGAINNL